VKSVFCLFLLVSAAVPAVNATETVATTTTVGATATVNVWVTDRRGNPLPSANVVVNGVMERAGRTNNSGRVVFTNMQAGDYILRVERDKFITFEKDFAVNAQTGSTHVVAAVSPLSSLTVRPSKATASARRH
jgi:Carboxypeptidase regulatory-like domain